MLPATCLRVCPPHPAVLSVTGSIHRYLCCCSALVALTAPSCRLECTHLHRGIHHTWQLVGPLRLPQGLHGSRQLLQCLHLNDMQGLSVGPRRSVYISEIVV